VVHVNSLKQRLADGAVVVDISIDEKGAILDPEIRRAWSLEQIIEHLSHSFAGSRNRVYRALANMPRAYPQPASRKHGETVLPYIATLLFLAAREGGAEGAIRHLSGRAVDGRSPDPHKAEPARVLDALVQDLRNGMAFYPRLDPQSDGHLVVSDTVADRASVFDFLYRQQIPFEFSTPARGEAEREREKAAFSVFPDPIRECLSYAVDRGVPFRVITHPGIDGTRTGNAEKALGVGAEKVLKCLVFRADDRYVAAICTGRKHVLEERLRELTHAREVRLASPDEVLKATGHTKGGVPPVQVFATVSAVFVDEGVMRQDAVYGSAGTELAGMRIAPSALKSLGAQVARITPEDGRLRRSEARVRKLLERFERAMEEDDDAAAREVFDELGQLLEAPAPSLR
jgi:prolyl-tRNA editing enzyme YbaK/EbsC (Cys-tRNA(Pro) deacylase)